MDNQPGGEPAAAPPQRAPRRTRLLWVAAAAAVLATGAVALAPGVGRSVAAPADSETGDVFVSGPTAGTYLVEVVGGASSGGWACDRLVLEGARRQGDEYVVEIGRSSFAGVCNDDLLYRLVRVRVPAEELTDVERISVVQDGTEMGVHAFTANGT